MGARQAERSLLTPAQGARTARATNAVEIVMAVALMADEATKYRNPDNRGSNGWWLKWQTEPQPSIRVENIPSGIFAIVAELLKKLPYEGFRFEGNDITVII
jgi:hypothetical protein